jgi:hypothetical protein
MSDQIHHFRNPLPVLSKCQIIEKPVAPTKLMEVFVEISEEKDELLRV